MPDPNDQTNTGDQQKADQTQTSAEKKPEPLVITVDGQKREVTQEELIKLAEKSAGADEAFRKASELRKEAQSGIHTRDLISKLNDGDYMPTKAEVAELAGMIGVDPADFQAYLEGPADDEDDDTVEAMSFDEMFQQTVGMSPADVKEILALSHTREVNGAREQIRGESDNAVDKDEILGKLIIGEHGKDRAEVIKDLVAEDVFGRIRNGEPYGADLIAKSVQKVRAQIKRFGILDKPDPQAMLTIGPGPSEGLPAEVQSETPIKRIPADEDRDGSNFVARYVQKALMKRRAAGNR